MRRNTAKVLRQPRSPQRPLRQVNPAAAPTKSKSKSSSKAKAKPQVQAEAEAAPLTVGDLIAATFDVVGDDPLRVAEVIASPELRRRIDRQIFFV